MPGPGRLSRDAEEFLTWLAVEQGRARNTIAAYRRDLLALRGVPGRRGAPTVDDVDVAVVEEHLADRRAAGLGPASVARALAAVRGLHRFRLEEGWATADPTADVRPPRAPAACPRPSTRTRCWPLLDAAARRTRRRRPRDRAILEVLYGTGMRVSELAGLGLGDLGSDTGLVRVLGKGDKERLVPAGPLRRRRARRAGSAPGARPSSSPGAGPGGATPRPCSSTPGAAGSPARGCGGCIEKRARAAGLEDRVHPHVLRHSCATHMLAHGADIRVVQELLGHASMATTQLYTRVSPEHLRRGLRAGPSARRGTAGAVISLRAPRRLDRRLPGAPRGGARRPAGQARGARRGRRRPHLRLELRRFQPGDRRAW